VVVAARRWKSETKKGAGRDRPTPTNRMKTYPVITTATRVTSFAFASVDIVTV